MEQYSSDSDDSDVESYKKNGEEYEYVLIDLPLIPSLWYFGFQVGSGRRSCYSETTRRSDEKLVRRTKISRGWKAGEHDRTWNQVRMKPASLFHSLFIDRRCHFSQGVLRPMVLDANGNSVPAESVLQLREATLKNLHHHTDDLRASESSDDEGDGGQVKPNKWNKQFAAHCIWTRCFLFRIWMLSRMNQFNRARAFVVGFQKDQCK